MKIVWIALAVCCLATAAFGTPLIVQSVQPAWQAVSGASSPTWVLPATTSCGSENEPDCEPTGTFYLNQTWSGIPSYIKFFESDGTTLSDIVTFDSNGPHGLMRVLFFSDPSLPSPSFYSSYFDYANYTEDNVNGFVTPALSVCCILNGNSLSVVLASDGESFFDPFGAGFDTSDGIQFQGAVSGTFIPEPGTVWMVLSGLGAAALYRRRRLAR